MLTTHRSVFACVVLKWILKHSFSGKLHTYKVTCYRRGTAEYDQTEIPCYEMIYYILDTESKERDEAFHVSAELLDLRMICYTLRNEICAPHVFPCDI